MFGGFISVTTSTARNRKLYNEASINAVINLPVRSRVSRKYAIKTGKRIPKFNAVPSVSAMIIVEQKQTSHDQALSTRFRHLGRVIGEVTCEQLSFGLTCISCRALRYNEKFRHDLRHMPYLADNKRIAKY